MTDALHEASDAELETLWPTVRAARLFDTAEAFRAWRDDGPWRVRLDWRGNAVVLEGWREHLDILQLRALWCRPSELRDVLQRVKAASVEQGYGSLLSPLLSEKSAAPYLASGWEAAQRLVGLQARPRRVAELSAGGDVVVRGAEGEDLGRIEALDAECFEPFWRYGRAKLREGMATARMTVATSDDAVLGYTLSTVSRGAGTLACLAVDPHKRRAGIGRALLAETATHMAMTGVVSMNLCTQEENAPARTLYAKAGFSEIRGRLVLVSDRAPGRTAPQSGTGVREAR